MKIIYRLIMIAGLAVTGFNLFGCYVFARQALCKRVTRPVTEPKKVETTLAFIKPDAVKARNRGKIIDMIEQNNFDIVHMRQTSIPKERAKIHYGALKEKPFFNEIIDFITSGPSIVMALEKENAIEDWRNLMGPTDPSKAKQGTIRKRFGTDVLHNAVHGSDSPESASKELALFFPKHYVARH